MIIQINKKVHLNYCASFSLCVSIKMACESGSHQIRKKKKYLRFLWLILCRKQLLSLQFQGPCLCLDEILLLSDPYLLPLEMRISKQILVMVCSKSIIVVLIHAACATYIFLQKDEFPFFRVKSRLQFR